MVLLSKTLARVVSIAFAGATVVACGQIAGIEDGPVIDDSIVAPPAKDKPTGTVDERTDENIVITPTELDFGPIECGKDSTGKVITISNKGDTATRYKIVLPENTAFRIMGALEGALPAGATVNLQAFAKPTLANDNTTDIVVTAGAAVRNLKPRVRGIGVTLEFLPVLWNFGDVRDKNGAAPIDIELTNKGNAPVVVSGFTGLAEFTLVGATGQVTLDPDGGKAKLRAGMKIGAPNPTALVEVAKPTFAQVQCGVPPELTLKGRRRNENILLSGGDWGKVSCASNPPQRDVVVSNYSGNALMYDATLQAGSLYTIMAGASGTVAASDGNTAKTATITVRPKPYATKLGAIAETINVTFSSPAGTPSLSAPLTIDYRGSIVTITPLTLSFTSDGVQKDTKTFTAQNIGNEAVFLYWQLTRLLGGPAWNGAGPGSLLVNETRNGVVDFTPSTTGTSTARFRPQVDFFSPSNTCTAPATIELSGVRPP